MKDDSDRTAMIRQLARNLEQLVSFADAENDPVLAAKLEDARSVFNMRFVWASDRG